METLNQMGQTGGRKADRETDAMAQAKEEGPLKGTADWFTMGRSGRIRRQARLVGGTLRVVRSDGTEAGRVFFKVLQRCPLYQVSLSWALAAGNS